MASRIEDYGLIGDLHTAALVGIDGSIDWLCLPRFDSAACFASLLGTDANGLWSIRPAVGVSRTTRRYRPGTLVLETRFDTGAGSVILVDYMPVRQVHPRVIRVVEAIEGKVPMRLRLLPRFDYGRTRPWLRANTDSIAVGAGPAALELRADVPLEAKAWEATSDFTLHAGERAGFVLTSHASWQKPPAPLDAWEALAATETWWTEWSRRSTYAGPWVAEVERSLITLKALTYAPTGGMVAAATTSLPEVPGGVRNWDYRYCWLRDAALSLDALMAAGYVDEATAWRDWLLRAVAGDPDDIQVMYGLGGERWAEERELTHLVGYEGSRPVRVGNAAADQLQLDVYGELADAIYRARELGMRPSRHVKPVALGILEWLADHWREPDNGIWEVRGSRRQFVHSKVMAWVAVDRLLKLLGPSGIQTARFAALRDEMHADICRNGFHAGRKSFTQSYGSDRLDASLLLIPQVGFLPPTDPRVVGTVEAIQRELVRDGLVMRYASGSGAVDALPGEEGSFLACSFWLVIDLALMGRRHEAQALFERLLSLRNDVGLLAEEYDPVSRRQVGNVPQALTHLTLVAAAKALSVT